MGIFDWLFGGKKTINKNITSAISKKDRFKKSYHENGQLLSEGNKIEGNQDGLWKYYYENGQLEEESNWKDGNQDGLQKYYYKNGQLEEEGNKIEGNQDGLWKYYHENGQVKTEGNFNEGKKECLWKYYHENGQLQLEANLKDGKQEGLIKIYYENGQLQEESNWKDGKRSGLTKFYYENGQLREESNWKDGNQDGLAPDRVEYKDDFKDGKKVIDQLLLKFPKNIEEFKFEFHQVQNNSKFIKNYYSEEIEIEKMIDHFSEKFRIEALEKFDKKELNVDVLHYSIEGFCLICQELRKIIETQKKLFNQGKLPGTNFDLLSDYWSAKSLHGGYVQALIILSNDPKYDNYKSKVSIKKLGVYINEHKL